MPFIVLTVTPSAADGQDEEGERFGVRIDQLAVAPGGGIGGFFDYINKLSGPAFAGGGAVASFRPPFRRTDHRVRLSVSRLTAVRKEDAVTPASADITMNQAQLIYDVPLGTVLIFPVSLGAGMAIHQFTGDFDSDVWTHSYIGELQLRSPQLIFDRLLPSITVSLNAFDSFSTDDFTPLQVEIPRGVREWVGPNLLIGVDYVF